MSKASKVVYFILFVLLIIHPHFITGHVFSLPQAYAQSLMTLLILTVAFLVYQLHEREVAVKEKEKNIIRNKLDFSINRLIKAYQYIGLINRRLPLLNKITTKLLQQPRDNRKEQRLILVKLLSTATVSLARAKWGMFRFIDVKKERTVSEFTYNLTKSKRLAVKLSNRLLLDSTSTKLVFEQGDKQIIRTADQEAEIQCFFICQPDYPLTANDIHILQALVDQAQLFYQYLLTRNK